MSTAISRIWTPGEIAEVTKTTVDDVIAELVAGRMPGFRIGTEWRVRDEAFQAFMTGQTSVVTETNSPTIEKSHEQEGNVQWQPANRFDYTWPDGKTTETCDPVYETDVSLGSGRYHFVIGYTTRDTAGMKDRRRVIVFLGHPPKAVPVVEFSGTNDFAQTRRLASIIKNQANKHVRSYSQLPPEYQGLPTVVYSDVVVGPYAARSMAVVATEHDRNLMLQHGIKRAKDKGFIAD